MDINEGGKRSIMMEEIELKQVTKQKMIFDESDEIDHARVERRREIKLITGERQERGVDTE
jgi:hypothetical protein